MFRCKYFGTAFTTAAGTANPQNLNNKLRSSAPSPATILLPTPPSTLVATSVNNVLITKQHVCA